MKWRRTVIGWMGLAVGCWGALSACAGTGTAAPAPTPTIVPATATTVPSPTLAASPTPTPVPSATSEPTVTPTPTPAPVFVRTYTATPIAEIVQGEPLALSDGNPETWVSLRGGQGRGVWVLQLDAPGQISAVRLWPLQDQGDDAWIEKLEISSDGQTWQSLPLNNPACSATGCQFTEKQWAELRFTPVSGQWLRLSSGPHWLTLAELEVEVTAP